MVTTTNETISQEAEPVLQLKKSLLPINEYAARKGLSIDIVEECARLGIIRIRKYKGRTFVVDVPRSPYTYDSETIDEPTKTKDKPESTGITQTAVYHLGILTEQAEAKRTWQITALLSFAFFLIALFGSFWFYFERNLQLERLEQARASIQMAYSNSGEAAQQMETLQNTLKNSKVQIERARAELANYKAQVTTLQEAAQQTETLQNTLKNSKAQIERARAELANYKTQVTTLQNELTQVRQNLKDVQERNVEAVQRLNRRIQELSEQQYKNSG